jgi:acyl-CoA thioester hydrolase
MSVRPELDHPHVHEIRIDWADLDVFEHINNVAYFRYMQSARIALCTASGFSWDRNTNAPGFVVASTKCDFLSPLLFPDTITVLTRVSHISVSSFELEHVIVSGNKKISAVGKDVLVCYNFKTGKKMPIENTLMSKLEAFQTTI